MEHASRAEQIQTRNVLQAQRANGAYLSSVLREVTCSCTVRTTEHQTLKVSGSWMRVETRSKPKRKRSPVSLKGVEG